MRNNRTTVRSLVTTQGTCLAMSDGLVIWETPANRKTLHLRTTATAILGVKEDDVDVSKLYVGDKLGQLHILQLPEFTLVSTSTISHASLRSMCMNDESQLLIADAEGRIFAADTYGKASLLFETNRSVSSIRADRGTIRIQSGWEQCVYNHDGTLSNRKDASTSFGDNLMLRRMREKKAIEAQRREAEAQLRLLPSA